MKIVKIIDFPKRAGMINYGSKRAGVINYVSKRAVMIIYVLIMITMCLVKINNLLF